LDPSLRARFYTPFTTPEFPACAEYGFDFIEDWDVSLLWSLNPSLHARFYTHFTPPEFPACAEYGFDFIED
jgi:hypothetical protein